MNENTSYAQALARHVKAALLHLRQAEKIAEVAGTDLDTSEHDVPEAGLFRAAGDAGQDLDLWASCNAHAQEAPDAATPGMDSRRRLGGPRRIRGHAARAASARGTSCGGHEYARQADTGRSHVRARATSRLV